MEKKAKDCVVWRVLLMATYPNTFLKNGKQEGSFCIKASVLCACM